MYKFILAAGGTGSRLAPMTSFLNKHLAPCGNGTLMIDYPLGFYRECGVSDLTIVTGSNHATQIVEYVGDGKKYGFSKVDYSFQPKPAGIADVLNRISSRHVEGVYLLLADNFFSLNQNLFFHRNPDNACAWEFDVGDINKARAFGQAIVGSDGVVSEIIEKPSNPSHSRILTGLYYFPGDVFEKVENLSPSSRNELEITGLLSLYLKESKLTVKEIDGQWMDLGEWSSWQSFVSTKAGIDASYCRIILK